MNKEEKETYVVEVFNHIARDYDAMNLMMTWGLLPRWQKKVLRLTHLPLGGRAIDICCGTGEMTLRLAQHVGVFGEVVGVDLAAEMLDAAREKQLKSPYRHISFVQDDALQLKQPQNAFDAATSGFALRNVSDIPQAINEMARVVRPGGYVVCMDVSRPLFPPARLFFNWYYFKFVPRLGDRLVSRATIGNHYSPYRWLAESLRHFPNRRTICRYYHEAGLIQVKAHSLGFGAVTIYSGRKPDAEERALGRSDSAVKLKKIFNRLQSFLPKKSAYRNCR